MFRFKHFSLDDAAASMKTGTDAVMLGAWADVSNAAGILDVGTGCGIIALMMAQRSEAVIDAIDIDEASALQARQNVEQSPWPERIKVQHISFRQFTLETLTHYDAVISNPPFFHRSLKAPDPSRCRARHDDELPAPDFMQGAAKILKPGGKIHLIFPFENLEPWNLAASNQQLHCHHVTRIVPKEGKAPNRVLATFSNKPGTKIEDQITIHHADGGFTNEYRQLTRYFYLAF